MARTVIDLDDEALSEAARLLGTSTKKDTVNAALREIIDRHRRAAAVARMREMVADGEIDLSMIERTPRVRRRVERVTGVLLVGFALRLAVQ